MSTIEQMFWRTLSNAWRHGHYSAVASLWRRALQSAFPFPRVGVLLIVSSLSLGRGSLSVTFTVLRQLQRPREAHFGRSKGNRQSQYLSSAVLSSTIPPQVKIG